MAVTFVLVVLAASSAAVSSQTTNCICTREYDPQCGADGKTYSNPCVRDCASTRLAYTGECVTKTTDCVCPAIYDPVCGTDGQTYSSSCSLGCAGNAVEVAYDGECRKTEENGCFCLQDYDPVCGTDAKTYSNNCTLACANATWDHSGECAAEDVAEDLTVNVVENVSQDTSEDSSEDSSEGCVCIAIYDPVCGSDNNTYGSACSLGCLNNGVSVAYSGECRADCVCTAEINPVCDTEGNSYSNECRLRCAGATLGHCRRGPWQRGPHSGPWRRQRREASCFCTAEYAPVCGTNGKTYSNACSLDCAGAPLAYSGLCNAS